jgi:hypothetical protein
VPIEQVVRIHGLCRCQHQRQNPRR